MRKQIVTRVAAGNGPKQVADELHVPTTLVVFVLERSECSTSRTALNVGR